MDVESKKNKRPLLRAFIIWILLPVILFGFSFLISLVEFSLTDDDHITSQVGIIMGTMAIFWGCGGLWKFSKLFLISYKSGLIKFRPINIRMPVKRLKFSKKILFVPIAVLLLLMLLNPSYNSFKEFSSDVITSNRKIIYKRKYNWLIFSIYEKQIVNVWDGEYEYIKPERYLGICMNFYKIKA